MLTIQPIFTISSLYTLPSSWQPISSLYTLPSSWQLVEIEGETNITLDSFKDELTAKSAMYKLIEKGFISAFDPPCEIVKGHCHFPRCNKLVDMSAPSCCRDRYCPTHWPDHQHET